MEPWVPDGRSRQRQAAPPAVNWAAGERRIMDGRLVGGAISVGAGVLAQRA